MFCGFRLQYQYHEAGSRDRPLVVPAAFKPTNDRGKRQENYQGRRKQADENRDWWAQTSASALVEIAIGAKPRLVTRAFMRTGVKLGLADKQDF